MVSLAKAAQADNFPADITLVISNRPDAVGLDKAKALGIQTLTIDHTSFSTRRAFEKALDAVLREAGIELICCAGFMRILSAAFVRGWKNRILNIHPSLLPKYKGLHTHQRAIEAGDTYHGASVHYVTAELDGGAIVAQTKLKILTEDTAETLSERLLPLELALYPKALKLVAAKLQSTQF
jgi:phosphoribosylglycinamide formyltransferase-1